MFGSRIKTVPSTNGHSEEVTGDLLQIKRDLHQQVIGALDLASIGNMPEKQLRDEVRRITEQLCRQRKDLLNQHERDTLIAEVMDEVFGLGPLEPLFKDPEICDILVNGPHTVYVERRGRLELSKVKFIDEAHVLAIIHRVAGRVGRRVDETTPMVDARLPDGSRLNAIVAPLALGGPLVSIRRFGARPLTANDLISNHSLTPDMYQFLAACVQARVNVLVSGGTGSGKTTLLNALSAAIPADERVATIEDAAELQLQQPHVVRMETRPANIEGQGEINTRELVRNALRMRPDRILVGECRGAEALDMLQAMNTGHEGSLTTVHANTPRDALGRLEIMVGMAGIDIPMWSIRRQIVSAIHIVVQTARLIGGARKVVSVAEITGMEGDVISMHNIFEFRQTGLDKNRSAVGQFHANGIHPHCANRLRNAGIFLPDQMFASRALNH
jgi:pilus assembly protein CpaF